MQQTRIVSFSWNDKNDFFVKNSMKKFSRQSILKHMKRQKKNFFQINDAMTLPKKDKQHDLSWKRDV